MRICHYTEVLGALVRLGCEELLEDDDHLWVHRWDIIQPIPKDERVPIWVQWKILTALGFDEEQYIVAQECAN